MLEIQQRALGSGESAAGATYLSLRIFVSFIGVFVPPRDFEILGWCPAGPVLFHGEKVPIWPWLATLLVMVSR